MISHTQSHVMSGIENLLQEHKGTSCVFQCIEFLREKTTNSGDQSIVNVDSCQDYQEQDGSALHQLSTRSSYLESEVPLRIQIYHGNVTTERKSTFQAHFSYVQSMEDVHMFRSSVLSDKKVKYSLVNHSRYDTTLYLSF